MQPGPDDPNGRLMLTNDQLAHWLINCSVEEYILVLIAFNRKEQSENNS